MAGSKTQPVISVEPVDGQDGQEVADFYRIVLTPHFRGDELETEENIAVGLRSGGTRALVARTEDGTIVGGAVVDWFARSHVLLLSYIAVLPGLRGGGAGVKLIAAAVSGEGAAGVDPLLVVAEVEDPRHFSNDPVLGDPEARVRFYERLGARTLPVPFVQPALGAGRDRVPHLLLMVLGGSLAPRGTQRVDGETVELFLREYFEGCEGPLSPDDTSAQNLLAACRQPGGLPLLLIGDLPDLTLQ
jgi:GNAT superfamily N-acetyltransferase